MSTTPPPTCLPLPSTLSTQPPSLPFNTPSECLVICQQDALPQSTPPPFPAPPMGLVGIGLRNAPGGGTVECVCLRASRELGDVLKGSGTGGGGGKCGACLGGGFEGVRCGEGGVGGEVWVVFAEGGMDVLAAAAAGRQETVQSGVGGGGPTSSTPNSSVTPTLTPPLSPSQTPSPSPATNTTLPPATLAGIIAASILFLGLLTLGLFFYTRRRNRILKTQTHETLQRSSFSSALNDRNSAVFAPPELNSTTVRFEEPTHVSYLLSSKPAVQFSSVEMPATSVHRTETVVSELTTVSGVGYDPDEDGEVGVQVEPVQ
ncbi:hypothetical protein HDV05_004046 [Chytridiales sp. JEL 0842]|nr:hypothetical protein HDV05_004046 [Chytridiales sp. JEL 0842]